MTIRLSTKQREFLAGVAQSEMPTDDFPDGRPFYLSHTFMQFKFNTEGERERWYQNLELRQLITRTGNAKCFVRLTSLGKASLATAAKDKP